MIEWQQFTYGRFAIDYQLVYEERKKLAIIVCPDKSLVVRAPLNSKIEEIEGKLQKRGKWVLKQINFFDQFHPIQPDREYVSGETHYYLGRQYRLRIRKGAKESVKLISKFFMVSTTKPDDREYIKLLIRHWYADHARLLLDRRAYFYIEKILGSGYSKVNIKYSYLKKYWGKYDPDGSITFNIELVKTPIQCIDYVIVHELCHIVHPNHGKAFYHLMNTILPDWEKRKERLEFFGVK